MIATGLLWYDDDARRPLAVKIADAAQRFRERIGYEPTTCQLNPALAEKAANDRPKRATRRTAATPPAPELAVRIEPSESLRPNYFFVGVQAGDKLKRVRGWQSPDVIGDERRDRRTAHSRAPAPRRPATAHKAAAPAPAPVVAAAPPQGIKPAKPVAKAAKPSVAAAPPQAPAITPARVTKAAKPAKPAASPEIATIPTSAPVGVKAPKAARRAAKDAPIPAQETPRDAAKAAPLVAKSVKPTTPNVSPATSIPVNARRDTAKQATPVAAAKATRPSRAAAHAATVAAKTARPAAASDRADTPSPKTSAPARRAAVAPQIAKTNIPATPATPATHTAPAAHSKRSVRPSSSPKSVVTSPKSASNPAPAARAPRSAASSPRPTTHKRAVEREGAAQTSLWGDAMLPTPVTRRRKTA